MAKSTVIGLVRGTAGNVSVTAMWRRYGSTGISSPAMRPIEAAHGPAQSSSIRVATSRDIDAVDADAFSQPGAKTHRRGRVARRDVGRARDAVGGTESAAEHVVDVEHRHHAPGFIGIDPPGLGEAGAMPHLHVAAEVLDLLRLREQEEVADLA